MGRSCLQRRRMVIPSLSLSLCHESAEFLLFISLFLNYFVKFHFVMKRATAMVLVWQYGEKSGYESWKGLSWGMVSSTSSEL